MLPDHIEWAKFSDACWLGDGFYYSAYDHGEEGKEFSDMNEGHKIYYHKMGTPQSEDVLFYQNPAYPKRFYSVSVNKEETMMFLYESGAGQGVTLFVRDLKLGDKLTVVTRGELAVAVVKAPDGADAAAPSAAPAADAQPEVVKKGKEEDAKKAEAKK